MKKQIVYYTDSRLEAELADSVRRQIKKASDGIPIISVSQKILSFGKNICVGLKPRNYLSLYEQLLIGLEAADEDALIYLCEHDVFYHPDHFRFIPPREEKIYYNLNRFYFNRNKNFFLKAIGKRALSQGIAYRNILLDHAKEQVKARKMGIASPCMGPFWNFETEYPNIDTRHGGNLSVFGEFDESDKSPRILSVPYWGTPIRFKEKMRIKEKNIKTDEMLNAMFNYPKKESPIVTEIYRKDFPGMFKALEFTKGAEVGVKRGDYSEMLCQGIPRLHLLCIDDYRPTPKYDWDSVEAFFVIARKRLIDYDTDFIKKSSQQAADEDVPNESLDFVYIDADHTFDSIMQDIIIWHQKVRIGGIISGHDYDNPEVKAAVDIYAKIHNITYFITKTGNEYPDSSPSWFFARTS